MKAFRRITITLAVSVAFFLTLFLLLAWRAEWIPNVIVNETLQLPEHKNSKFRFEVRRLRVSRNILSLFSRNFEPAKTYDFRVMCDNTLVTSANFAFEGLEPSSGKVSWQQATAPAFPGAVLFDLGAGSSNITCIVNWGGSILWRRVGAKGLPKITVPDNAESREIRLTAPDNEEIQEISDLLQNADELNYSPRHRGR